MVGDIELFGEKLGARVREFKYLGSYITKNGTPDLEIVHTIQALWFSWKQICGIICDLKIRKGLKRIIYEIYRVW